MKGRMAVRGHCEMHSSRLLGVHKTGGCGPSHNGQNLDTSIGVPACPPRCIVAGESSRKCRDAANGRPGIHHDTPQSGDPQISSGGFYCKVKKRLHALAALCVASQGVRTLRTHVDTGGVEVK